jgi:taurine transport system permease protein
VISEEAVPEERHPPQRIPGAALVLRRLEGVWAQLRSPTFLVSLASSLGLLLAWIILTETGLANELFLPSPQKVFMTLVEVATVGYQGSTLLEHVATSLFRILVGFGLACAIGIPLGVLMGLSQWVRAFFNPMIEFYRPLPPLGLYTLLVMWLGIGEASKLSLLFLAAFPGIIISTVQAVSTIDPIYVRAAQSLGATKRDLFFHVFIPAAGPTILTGMRISLGFTYTVLVAAEIVAATAGIGWMIWDAAKFLLSDVVIGGLIVLGLTGVCLDLIMRKIGAMLMPWTRV